MKVVGKILLLISGILLLVVGLWSLITALIGLLAVVGGAAAGEDGAALQLVGIVIFVVSIVALLCYIFAGIRGIKTFTKGDSKNVNRAFIWAILILALNVFSLIYTKTFAASTIVALVVDVAYVTGAFMVKLSK